MYHLAIRQFVRTLKNLDAIIGKAATYAETRKFDVNNFVGVRLFPDMLPFANQVRIATDMAKAAAANLSGKEAPKFEDNEKTIDELRTRIKKTIDFIKSVPASAFEGGEDRDIKIVVPNRTFEMKGLTYLRGWVIPNVMFHVVTAYLILRHNGVDVGKRDFLGDLT